MTKNTISRAIQHDLVAAWQSGKIVILYGPRQVGKTTLLHACEQTIPEQVLRLDGDRRAVQEILSSQNLTALRNAVGEHRYVMIDEAQRIPNIGINLKLLHDNLPDLHVIATGSSSFDLANSIREPLTGRTRTFMLYPIAVAELQAHLDSMEVAESTELWLRYGLYPEVVTAASERERQTLLEELVEGQLFKDILQLENVRNPRALRELITLLALQIGSEVSLSELATQTHTSVHTVKRYLDLMEKAFLVFRVGGFSRNLRKELSKNAKYYFYDVGLRNAVLRRFQPLNLRDDKGALWENFLIAERIKVQRYQQQLSNNYFWRTYDGQEIDWLEERDGRLHAFELKWKAKPLRIPPAFDRAYPHKSFQLITRENYLDFIAPPPQALTPGVVVD